MKTLTDGEAMMVAATLLSHYEHRISDRQRTRDTLVSGERAYNESMTSLASHIVKLHPALAINIRTEHRGEIPVTAIYHMPDFTTMAEAAALARPHGITLDGFSENPTGNKIAVFTAPNRAAVARLSADLDYQPVRVEG